jgi:RND family efflux transporter MFP subunit
LLSIAVFLSPAYVAAQAPSSASLEVVIAGKPVRKTLTFTTTQPARVAGLERAPIHSKLSAYVAEVLVDYGDKVKKDQPLVKLAAPELDAEVMQRRALIEQARAEFHQAEAAARASEAAMQSARSRVAQAEAAISRNQADIERWKSEFARIEQLATSGSLNRQLVDETQQKYRFAEAGMKESQAAIDAARSMYGQSQAEAARATADIEAARARVRVAEANAAQTEALHSYLTITAPFDGVVTHRNIDPGAFVQPAAGGAPPLVVVARADKMRVFVAVPEVEAAYVTIGDPLSLEVPSLRGAEFKGQVTRTGFALDPDSRSLETIADLDNPALTLRPGLYGTVKIMLEEHANVLTLPAAAVVRQGKEAFCYKLAGGKAAKTPIKLGLKVGDDFEIASGVTDNDAVILNKASSLKDGQPVEVLKTDAKK